MNYPGRQAALRQALADRGVDALIVVSPANVRYLTGFTGEGLLLAGETMLLSSDSRYRAEAKVAQVTETVCEPKGHWAGIARLVREAGYCRVALEAQHTSVAVLEDLGKELDSVEFVPLRKAIEPLRQRKSEAEIDLLRRAARVTDKALEDFLAGGPLRQSEKLARLDLVRLMLERGAEREAFETIVACGPGSAEPHHTSRDTLLEGPAPLKIDLGACVAGYCADLTRTVYLGTPDTTFRKAYTVVYEAQQHALEAVRAGVAARDVDRAARQVIEEAGFGNNFGHGVGHGVGLEVHEGPRLGATSEDILEEGQVVTIEPGVYLQGWGGVRIEDLVVVRCDGAEVLSQAPKSGPEEL